MAKLPMSASHLGLYISLAVHVFISLLGTGITLFFITHGEYDYALQSLIALFSFGGVYGVVYNTCYTHKAQKENENKATDHNYDKRLSMATTIHEYEKQDRISGQSVAITKDLISESETSVTTNGFGGTTIVEDTKYTVDSIIDEIDEKYDNAEGLG